jgi:hypothetical protein
MGIHPVTGVVPSQANNAFVPEHPSLCDRYYPTDPCVTRIDVDALNALTSEVRRVIDAVGGYNCDSTNNMLPAIKKLICWFSYVVAENDPSLEPPADAANPVTVYNPDGTTTTCLTTTPADGCPSIWINKTTGVLWFYDREAETWIPVRSQQCGVGAPTEATPHNPGLYLDTVTKQLYVNCSGAWILVVPNQCGAGPPTGQTATRPGIYFDYTNQVLYVRCTDQWLAISTHQCGQGAPTVNTPTRPGFWYDLNGGVLYVRCGNAWYATADRIPPRPEEGCFQLVSNDGDLSWVPCGDQGQLDLCSVPKAARNPQLDLLGIQCTGTGARLVPIPVGGSDVGSVRLCFSANNNYGLPNVGATYTELALASNPFGISINGVNNPSATRSWKIIDAFRITESSGFGGTSESVPGAMVLIQRVS